jgi:aryl sulfotransferase
MSLELGNANVDMEAPADMLAVLPPGRNAWGERPIEIRNHTVDSRRWRAFEFRGDDIIVGTWARSGTTWVQQIIGQLIFGPVTELPVCDISPWVETRAYPLGKMLALLSAQEHRRFLKTHLPVDALVHSGRAKYIYIGRDGRDVLWSWFTHHHAMTDFAYDVTECVPGRVGPPLGRPIEDFRRYFHEWLVRDGFPLWSFWQNVESWWRARELPNVLLLHFNNLKADLPGEIRRIARFLDVRIDEGHFPAIVENCGFHHMKENAAKLSWYLEQSFKGGARSFINRGTGGNWKDLLTDEDVAEYYRYVDLNLSGDCARWLASGEREITHA